MKVTKFQPDGASGRDDACPATSGAPTKAPSAEGAGGETAGDGEEDDDDDDDGGPDGELAAGQPQAPNGPRVQRRTAFERLMARAGALSAGDHREARRLLRRARNISLPQGETKLLQGVIARAAGLTGAVVSALTADAEAYLPGHGYVHNTDELAKAVQADYLRRYGAYVGTEGKLFVYADAESADTPAAETGYWRARSFEQIEGDLLMRYAGNPAVQTASDRREVVRRLYMLNRVPDDFFSHRAPGLSLANGHLSIDRATGAAELLPHSAAHRATFRLPFAYDADAEAGDFVDALMAMMGGAVEKAACLLQFMAALLFGIMPALDKLRTVLILHGPTGSGKSTVVELLKRFVPEHLQASIPPDLWSDGYHRASLRGVLLNTVTELELTARVIKGAWFKLVASRESVSARPIREKPVTFVPQAAHLFACNKLPIIGEGGRSIERRLMVIGVPKMAEGIAVNPNFLDEVWAQAPGIVNLLVGEVGAMLEAGEFMLPTDNARHIVQMQFPDSPEEQVAHLWFEAAAGERVRSVDVQAAIRIEAAALRIDTTEWSSNTGMKPLSSRISKLYGATREAAGGDVSYVGIKWTAEAAARLAGAQDVPANGGALSALDDPAEGDS